MTDRDSIENEEENYSGDYETRLTNITDRVPDTVITTTILTRIAVFPLLVLLLSYTAYNNYSWSGFNRLEFIMIPYIEEVLITFSIASSIILLVTLRWYLPIIISTQSISDIYNYYKEQHKFTVVLFILISASVILDTVIGAGYNTSPEWFLGPTLMVYIMLNLSLKTANHGIVTSGSYEVIEKKSIYEARNNKALTANELENMSDEEINNLFN